MPAAELYNTSWMNSTTNLVDVVTGIGVSIGDSYLIGNLILLSFFVVFMVLAFKQDWHEILIIDSFISTILAMFLAFVGMIQFPVVSIPFIIFIIALFFYLFK